MLLSNTSGFRRLRNSEKIGVLPLPNKQMCLKGLVQIMHILRMKPVFKDMVWGGSALKEFGYENAGDNAGECWGISAHKSGDCIISNGEYAGKTLSWCYENHRELFGNIQDKIFPLLVKIIGAAQDLSIQVHPDNDYAAKKENGALGKTECWYILDCDSNATIVIGHNAKDKYQLEEMIKDERWGELINERSIKPGDFFHIEPGCLHAIKGGTLLIETQQSSDITYRVYDYDRISNGKKRPLHVKQSIDCINAPHTDYGVAPVTEPAGTTKITTYVVCEYFTLEKWEVNDKYEFLNNHPFVNVSVIEGEGTINGEEIRKGDHLIVTSNVNKCVIRGEITLIISYL